MFLLTSFWAVLTPGFQLSVARLLWNQSGPGQMCIYVSAVHQVASYVAPTEMTIIPLNQRNNLGLLLASLLNDLQRLSIAIVIFRPQHSSQPIPITDGD